MPALRGLALPRAVLDAVARLLGGAADRPTERSMTLSARQNADQVAEKHLSDLIRARDAIAGIVDIARMLDEAAGLASDIEDELS